MKGIGLTIKGLEKDSKSIRIEIHTLGPFELEKQMEKVFTSGKPERYMMVSGF